MNVNKFYCFIHYNISLLTYSGIFPITRIPIRIDDRDCRSKDDPIVVNNYQIMAL